ncbi:L-2,4-diaminobutyric acid acetyltransferase [Streptomyces laurentii]|uniref:L-2,4-diaminobutyric acid acetyltransferase n=1 Tax=Streptomyces laurentii TaxID=39478 RepID=A0A160PAQ9_STRLU|nr:L-2,4-diaminobutyric acid acetyltransferase [Streptomyces laurentii]
MTTAHPISALTGLDIGPAQLRDGADLWRLARDAGGLDVNSPYSYLLWCRDFAGTTAVARDDTGRAVGFVTGYLRPEAPGALFVWQVAVEDSYRGTGVAGALLDALAARVAAGPGLVRIEATVTPGNVASDRMFRSFARRHGAGVIREVLFPSAAFPGTADADDTHEPELLYSIGPLSF